MPSLKNIKISYCSPPPPPPPPPCEEPSPPPPPPPPSPPPQPSSHSSCSPCQHKNHSPPPPPPAAPAPAPPPPPPHPLPSPPPCLSPPPGNIAPPPKKPPIVAPPRPSTPPPFYPAIAPSPYSAPPLGSQVLSIAPMPAPRGGYNTPLVVGTSLSGLLFLSFIALGLNYFLPKKPFVPGSGGHGAPPTGGGGGPPLSQPSGNAAGPTGNIVHATSHVDKSNIDAPGSEGTSAPPPDKRHLPPAPSFSNAAEPKEDMAEEKPKEQVDEGEDEREKKKKFKGDTVIQRLNETTKLLRKLLAASNAQIDPAGPSQQEFAPEKKDGQENEEEEDAKADTGESKADALNTAMLGKNPNYPKSQPDSTSHDLEKQGDDEEPAADDEEGGESEFQNLQTHEDNPEKDTKEHDGGEGDDAIKPSRQPVTSASKKKKKEKPLDGPTSQGSRSNNNTRADLEKQFVPAAMTLVDSATECGDGEDINEEPNANKDAGDDGSDMSSQFSEGKKLATDIIHSDNKQARPVPTSRRQQTPRSKRTTHQLHDKIQQDSRTQSNQTAIGDEGGTGDTEKDPKDGESNFQDPSDPAGDTTMLAGDFPPQGDDEGPAAEEEGGESNFLTEDNPDGDDSKKTKEHDDGDDVSKLISQSVMAAAKAKKKKKKKSNNNDFNTSADLAKPIDPTATTQADSTMECGDPEDNDEPNSNKDAGDDDLDSETTSSRKPASSKPSSKGVITVANHITNDSNKNNDEGDSAADGTVDEEYESGLEFAGLDMGTLIAKGPRFLSDWSSKVENLVEKNAALANKLMMMRMMNEHENPKSAEADNLERSTFPNDNDKVNLPNGNDERERRVPKSDKAPGKAVTCGSGLVMGADMFEETATDDGAKEEPEYNTSISVVEENTVDDTSSLTSAQVADHEDNPDVAIAQNQDADVATGEFEERQAKSELADESEAGVKYNERKGNTKAARAGARPTTTSSVLKFVAESNVPLAADDDIVEENEKDTEERRRQDESGIMSSLDTESIILKAEGNIKGREEGAQRQKTKAQISTLSGVIGNQSFLGPDDRQVLKGSDEHAKGNLPAISGALKRQVMPEFTNPPGPDHDHEEDKPEFQAASILDADMVTGEFGEHQNVAAEREGVKYDKRRGNIKAPGKGKGVPTTSSIFKSQVMSELSNPLGLDHEEATPKFHDDIVAAMSSTPDANMETGEVEIQEQHQNAQRLDSMAKKIILPQKHEPLLKGNVGHKTPAVTKTSQVKQTKGLSPSDALMRLIPHFKEEQNDEKLQCSETTEIVADDVAAADAEAVEEEEEQSSTAAEEVSQSSV